MSEDKPQPPIAQRFLEVRGPMAIWPWVILMLAGGTGVGYLIDGHFKLGIIMIAVAFGPLVQVLFNAPNITISDRDIVVSGPQGWEMAYEEITEVHGTERGILLVGENRILEFRIRERDLAMVLREIESRRAQLRSGTA